MINRFLHVSFIRLSAFVAKTLHEARFGEWERDLFIPIELINKVVVFLCSKQNESGAWFPDGPIYDRKFVSLPYFSLCHAKNCFWGVWFGPTQKGLYSNKRWLKAFIEEGLHNLCSENKGADRLCVYRAADLRLCFCICKKQVFSWCGSFNSSLIKRS